MGVRLEVWLGPNLCRCHVVVWKSDPSVHPNVHESSFVFPMPEVAAQDGHVGCQCAHFWMRIQFHGRGIDTLFLSIRQDRKWRMTNDLGVIRAVVVRCRSPGRTLVQDKQKLEVEPSLPNKG